MYEIWMRFPDGKSKALTLSYDDGVEQDIQLISILSRYGLKCTFNLNSGLFASADTIYPKGTGGRRMTLQRCIETYAASGHEVALHGFHHAHMEELSPADAMLDIIQDRQTLESVFGRMVRGMAYPFGTYSDDLVNVLRMMGVAYARTVESTKSFSVPRDWLRMPATCHHADPQLPELSKRFLEAAVDKDPLLFYLWGHSYEFERDNNWGIIEDFAEQMGGRNDIWYATNMEIYEYVTAFRSLILSPGLQWVYNPSDKPIWFANNGTIQKIESGERKKYMK